MRSILLTLFVLGSLVKIFAQDAAVVGKYYSDDNCASGGAYYYFYEDGVVIMNGIAYEARPTVWLGTWSGSLDKVNLHFTKAYEGKPTGAIQYPVGSMTTYDAYSATIRDIEHKETFKLREIIDFKDGCDEVGTHNFMEPDVHDFLRKSNFEDTYAFTKTRVVDPAELKAYSKSELRIMRNEIFARYGYKFKSKDLREYFIKKGVYGNLENVSPFLTKIETKNIDLIRAAENAK
ncbi:MAG: YARHG domain-containing protein [Saprospiraceae bacterium]|nr:YARHG domain-containing protein [Saprospiraceae bacterium]